VGHGAQGDGVGGIAAPDEEDGSGGLWLLEGAESEGAASVFDGGGQGWDEGDAVAGGGHLDEGGEAGCVPGGFAAAGTVAEGEDLVSEAVAVGEEKEFLVGEVGRGGLFVCGQEGMVGERGEEEGVVADGRGVEGGESGVTGKDGGVEFAALELSEEGSGFVFKPDEADGWEGGSQGRGDLGQEVGGDGGDCANAEGSREGVAKLGRDVAEGLCGLEEAPGLLDPFEGGRDDGDAAVGAVEDLESEGLFDLGDLGGERGLRHTAVFGGSAEGGAFSNRHDILELTECEGVVMEVHAASLAGRAA
jgi:hypothetical protein